MPSEPGSQGFEDRAQGWLAWARTPGHDAYWGYRDAFFVLVPEPGAATPRSGAAIAGSPATSSHVGIA
jgi:hypothetical protein